MKETNMETNEIEMNEYEEFITPSEMVGAFEANVLKHILKLETALKLHGANAQVYSLHVCRFQVNDKNITVEANVQLKGTL